jgi:hypothetical protein
MMQRGVNQKNEAERIYIDDSFFIIYSQKEQIKYNADTRLQERNQEKHMVVYL